MENPEIAALLHETADLMEIAGEGPFRIRSYRNAAAAIEFRRCTPARRGALQVWTKSTWNCPEACKGQGWLTFNSA